MTALILILAGVAAPLALSPAAAEPSPGAREHAANGRAGAPSEGKHGKPGQAAPAHPSAKQKAAAPKAHASGSAQAPAPKAGGAGAPPGAQTASAGQRGFSERAINATMAFEKAPGVLSVSNRSKRLEGLRAYATEPLGLTAIGLEDAGLPSVNKQDKIEVNLGDRIRFDAKSDKIPPAAHRLLDGVGRVLAENPETRVEVRVHTDDQGDAEFNRHLSQQRADAIRAYLIGRGVAAERIAGVGMGESAPIAGGKGRFSASDRSKNRRTELTIAPREVPPTEVAAGAATDAEAPPEPGPDAGSDAGPDTDAEPRPAADPAAGRPPEPVRGQAQNAGPGSDRSRGP